MRRYYDMREFMIAAMQARRKRASFRIARTVEATKPRRFLCVRLDGGRVLHLVLEELAVCELGSGKAEGVLNKLCVARSKVWFYPAQYLPETAASP
ncbi:hypothetical protein [Vibrio sp. M260112]|uniref:hypothetical protein n=1 Tax=Vibrio sp. M260112 TaxID=3020895 RepID=UPI002F3F8083